MTLRTVVLPSSGWKVEKSETARCSGCSCTFSRSTSFNFYHRAFAHPNVCGMLSHRPGRAGLRRWPLLHPNPPQTPRNVLEYFAFTSAPVPGQNSRGWARDKTLKRMMGVSHTWRVPCSPTACPFKELRGGGSRHGEPSGTCFLSPSWMPASWPLETSASQMP